MDRFAHYIAAKREMADVLRAVGSQVRDEEMSVAVKALLDAGIADNTLRGDVPAQDVVADTVGVFLACGPDPRPSRAVAGPAHGRATTSATRE
jgi:hypothetical protein